MEFTTQDVHCPLRVRETKESRDSTAKTALFNMSMGKRQYKYSRISSIYSDASFLRKSKTTGIKLVSQASGKHASESSTL